MIAKLTGTIERGLPCQLIVDVQGVGYAVAAPLDVWEKLDDKEPQTLMISTYVREDRLELFGFSDSSTKQLFEMLIAQSGIGPKTALELCGVPRELLLQAIEQQDPGILTNVKGIGKKTAEKLLVELRSVSEKHPAMFQTDGAAAVSASYDQDAVSALTTLGYDTSTIMQVLKDLPSDLATTEERVAAALRSM